MSLPSERTAALAAPRYIPLIAGVEFVRSALMLVLLPAIGVHTMGLSMAVVGLAISAHYLFDNILRPFSGYLADQIGANKLLGGGLFLGSAAMVMMFSSQNAPEFVGAAALFGVGTSSLWPIVISRLTRDVPEVQRARALSAMYAAWMVASGAGTVIASALTMTADQYALPALTAVLLGSGVYALLVRMGSRHVKRFRMGQVIQNLNQDWRALIVHIRSSKWLFPGMYVQTLAIGLLIPIISPYAKEVLHDHPAEVTYAMLLVGGAAVATLPIFGRFVDRLGSRPFLVVGYLGAGIALCLFTLQTEFWPAAFVLILAGVSYAMVLPAWNRLLDRTVSDELRAAMWGIFMMVEGLGTATGPLISGELWVIGGPRAPFFATAIIVISMALLYMFLRHPGLHWRRH